MASSGAQRKSSRLSDEGVQDVALRDNPQEKWFEKMGDYRNSMKAAVILWIGHYSCDSNGEYEATEVILRRFKEFCGTISGPGKTEVSGWTAKQLMAHLRLQLDSSRLKRESVGAKSRKTGKYMIRAGTGIKHAFGMKNKAVIDVRKLERLEKDREILQSPQVQTALARAGQQGARAPVKATGCAEEESSSSSSSSSAAASATAKGQKEEEEVRPGTTYAGGGADD